MFPFPPYLTKCVSGLLSVLFLMTSFSTVAAYERNKAVPVEKVVYGRVESIRYITQKQLIEDRNVGWKTFGGAVVGGVIGHQFGGGSGQDIATVLGALLGGAAANKHGDSTHIQQYQLIEMLISLDDGSQVMVLQDIDPDMPFTVGDEVRVVYLTGYVRVDIAM
ncbi:glycine zipper 2TM domain-containing protein [Vibrio albus]|nr:glycine zipper 2TM domain-containing protein [Vibrio albus]